MDSAVDKPTASRVHERGQIEYLRIASRLEEIEIDLLCEAIYRYYGFDFREYARSSLGRRVRNLLTLEKLSSISALQERVLHDRQVMERFLLNLSINVTAMFRDPGMYLTLRNIVIPMLKTYSSVRVWHAGCSSGEEVYSMGILFEEEDVSDKSIVYATDFNESILERAQSGIVPLSEMKKYTNNYQQSGGKRSFSEYYTAKHESIVIASRLLKSVVFSRHNLATDSSFNEFNLIVCRNVLIYFNDELRNRVLLLLHESLCRFGILVLGTKESLKFTPLEKLYRELNGPYKIYQRID